MNFLKVLLRSLCRALAPLFVEGIYGDIWNYKKIITKKHNNFYNKFLQYIYFRYMESKSCWIGLDSNIQGKPTTPHGLFGIFVSNKSQIGKNAVIFHHVTIGSNNLPDSKRRGSPIIGDNVYIGAGAKIIGKVKIGNSVRIGANCIVVKDVPENSVVITKGTCVIQKGAQLNNTYIENK